MAKPKPVPQLYVLNSTLFLKHKLFECFFLPFFVFCFFFYFEHSFKFCFKHSFKFCFVLNIVSSFVLNIVSRSPAWL